jgi:uncharacterized membrane protein YkgB
VATGSPQTSRAVDQRLLLGGGNIIRYGLVVVIVYIGALKFTASEATRIQPLFIGTLSFLFTTPGVTDAAAGGFPALSSVGQFLLKDLVLIGASVWTLGESLSAATAAGRLRPTRLRRPPTGRATASP